MMMVHTLKFPFCLILTGLILLDLCFIVALKYHGFTALIEASAGGYLEVVNALLAAGADINAKITWVSA